MRSPSYNLAPMSNNISQKGSTIRSRSKFDPMKHCEISSMYCLVLLLCYFRRHLLLKTRTDETFTENNLLFKDLQNFHVFVMKLIVTSVEISWKAHDVSTSWRVSE
ncbi:hypothetical protein MOUN0_C02894 [Monosporozyma unispora]